MINFIVNLEDEEFGKYKGKKAILPAEIFVESGVAPTGMTVFTRVCLRHQVEIPDSGCDQCKK